MNGSNTVGVTVSLVMVGLLILPLAAYAALEVLAAVKSLGAWLVKR